MQMTVYTDTYIFEKKGCENIPFISISSRIPIDGNYENYEMNEKHVMNVNYVKHDYLKSLAPH